MHPSSFTGPQGGHPAESFFNHLSPSLLAAAAASASQAGVPSNALPFLNLQDLPPAISSSERESEEPQGQTEKDTKLKEILSHIYQYVSRQYNQRLNEQQEAPKRPSPNSLSRVSKF